MRYKHFLKNNILTKNLYYSLKAKKYSYKYSSLNLINCNPIYSNSKELRFNIVLPVLIKERVFGGITTAISFLMSLCNSCHSGGRIILYDENENEKDLDIDINGFNINRDKGKSIVYLKDDRTLDVGENDYFIYTDWRSAYIFSKVFLWQINTYDLANRKSLYLIQDYEPAFCAWSSEFAEADSTYRRNADKIIAIFNSRQLYDYFANYSFYKKIYFEPAMPEKLKTQLYTNFPIKRKKQILIYGRPGTERNAFSLIKDGLTIWSESYYRAKEWSVVSLGEQFENIRLKNNTIVLYGKVSLEQYANIMKESYVGISLMISPHPSYPPLEMSTFGIRTITNRFANKDLADFNDNIISLDYYSPEDISSCLIKLCDEFDNYESHVGVNKKYIDGVDYERAVDEVIKEVERML